MSDDKTTLVSKARDYIRSHLSHAQHRNAYFLMLNGIVGAFVGIAFWLVVARLVGSAEEVGVGFSVIALGTTIAVIAKGGLDTALLRAVPSTTRKGALRLLWFGILVGSFAALALTGAAALASSFGLPGTEVLTTGWLLVVAIAILLVATWLQDAYFLAEGSARFSFFRNLVFSGARILLPVPIILLASPRPIALTWALALLISFIPAAVWARRFPAREGRTVPRREYLKSATRNVSGGAAEFLPGLVLAPLVLALSGAANAGYFAMAWTGASLLFLLSASISRSALSEMVRSGKHALAIRRSIRHQLLIVVPGAIGGIVLAPIVLSLFGRDYATYGAVPFMILCASTLFVAPAFTYLAVLRAQERPVALFVFPVAMIAVLFALTPPLLLEFGLPGVAAAWFIANIPVGVYGAYRLRQAVRDPIPHTPSPAITALPQPE